MDYTNDIRNCSTPAELFELQDHIESAAFELHSEFVVTGDPRVAAALQLATSALEELAARLEGYEPPATGDIPF